ncbi:MAG TPA: hypothetical protein VLR90_11270 [Blastocatellia bacterium]|nr:hypothetical protein [Blastocatellia bacterium]
MKIPRREDIVALDERIEAEAKSLTEKIDERADLFEVEEVVANLNELLQSRHLTKVLLDKVEREAALAFD